MSSSAWWGVKLAAVLFLAGVLQAAFANSVQVWGARPDLLLTTALVGAMFCGEGPAALLGFSAALLHASIAAPPHAGVGSILVSRTLVCFGIGRMEERLYRDSVVVALLVTLLGTLAAEGLFFAFYPQQNIQTWARQMLLTTAWNSVLAAPVYYAMRALRGGIRE